jgi:hypothetical protein
MNPTHFVSLTTVLATTLMGSFAAAEEPAPAAAPPVEAQKPIDPNLVPIDTKPAEPPIAVPEMKVIKKDEAKNAGYDKAFFIKSDDGKFELKIKARVQALYNVTSKVAADTRAETGNFSIRRARLVLEGHIFGNDLTYKFQTDFGRGFVHLKDFMADAKIGDHVFIRAGQWKKPFSRQQIISSANLELVDRAITDGAFRAGRDVGLAIHNDYEKSPEIEWVVGVFSGFNTELPGFSGTANPTTGAVTGGFGYTPNNAKPMLLARVGYNHGKVKGYGTEADLDGGPLRAAVAIGGIAEFDGDKNGVAEHRLQTDFVIKNEGLSVSGAGYFMTAGTGFAKSQKSSLLGGQLQVGYVLEKKWQPAGRVAFLKGFGDVPAPTQTDLDVGFNYYYHGNDAKIMVDVGVRKTGSAGFGDDVRGNLSVHVGF